MVHLFCNFRLQNKAMFAVFLHGFDQQMTLACHHVALRMRGLSHYYEKVSHYYDSQFFLNCGGNGLPYLSLFSVNEDKIKQTSAR